jgi:hypothetical protein
MNRLILISVYVSQLRSNTKLVTAKRNSQRKNTVIELQRILQAWLNVGNNGSLRCRKDDTAIDHLS